MFSSFSFFGGRNPNDFIVKANQHKSKKEWLEAGDAFIEAAELHYQGKNREYEVADSLSNAANCYMKEHADRRLAIWSLRSAAHVYAQKGEFMTAARQHETIAELAVKLSSSMAGGSSLDWEGDIDKSENKERRDRLVSLYTKLNQNSVDEAMDGIMAKIFKCCDTAQYRYKRLKTRFGFTDVPPINPQDTETEFHTTAQGSSDRLINANCDDIQSTQDDDKSLCGGEPSKEEPAQCDVNSHVEDEQSKMEPAQSDVKSLSEDEQSKMEPAQSDVNSHLEDEQSKMEPAQCDVNSYLEDEPSKMEPAQCDVNSHLEDEPSKMEPAQSDVKSIPEDEQSKMEPAQSDVKSKAPLDSTADSSSATPEQPAAAGFTTHLKLAIEHLEIAASYYDSERSPVCAAACQDKRARLMAKDGGLADAAKVFHELVKQANKLNVLSIGVRDYAFRACLCKLAGGLPLDTSDESNADCLDSIKQTDEGDLVDALMVAADVGAFDNAISKFERFNELDEWSRGRLKEARELLEVISYN